MSALSPTFPSLPEIPAWRPPYEGPACWKLQGLALWLEAQGWGLRGWGEQDRVATLTASSPPLQGLHHRGQPESHAAVSGLSTLHSQRPRNVQVCLGEVQRELSEAWPHSPLFRMLICLHPYDSPPECDPRPRQNSAWLERDPLTQ